MPAGPAERWVCLDVGETLIDETRVWSTWADLLGIPRLTFLAALGAVLARGDDHRQVFELFDRPDWRDLRPSFDQTYAGFRESDLYLDALPTIESLRAAGYRLAIVANQPARRNNELGQLGVGADVVAMSDELGAHKPSPEFFDRVLERIGMPDPATVAHVGDRIDNDVRPSLAAGMRPVWLRRGPWALLTPDSAPDGTLVVESLTEFVERIDECWP